MSTNRPLALLLSVVLYVLLLIGALKLTKAHPELGSLVIAVTIAPCAALISMFAKPYIHGLDRYVSTPRRGTDVCNIYLFGLGGTGKTTLITQWTGNSDGQAGPTQEFEFHYRTIEKGKSGRSNKIQTVLADYQGQTPSQILDEIISSLESGRRHSVNSIIFLIDLIETEDSNGETLDSPARQLEWVAKDTNGQRVRDRIERNRFYVEGSLPFLFYFMGKPQLSSVKLVVNKIDIIQQAIADGHISTAPFSNAEDWVADSISKLQSTLKKVCNENGITDFSTDYISALNGNGVNSLFGEIVNSYDKKKVR